jgi:hypothetical protein
MAASCPARADQLQPVQAWHHDVADDQVGLAPAGLFQRGLTVLGRTHVVARRAQQPAEVVAHVDVVVGDQDLSRCATGPVVTGRHGFGRPARIGVGRDPAQRLLDERLCAAGHPGPGAG